MMTDKEEYKDICDRVKQMIDSSDTKHKKVLDRYISLANKRLHKISDNNSDVCWDIVGASMGLMQRYKSKFGRFYPRTTHN